MKRLAILAATLAFALVMSIDAAMATPDGNGGGGGGARPELAPFRTADPGAGGGGGARPEPQPFQTDGVPHRGLCTTGAAAVPDGVPHPGLRSTGALVTGA